ncbi:MAG: glycosyltransferase family 2 protein [Deltaproteobacteria bacterium]|nr:glycosyltransferase family 2 protein [Deltaproteobacteria bacterium]
MSSLAAIHECQNDCPEEALELTVLAPMYNEADNIVATVTTINEALSQFGRSWELLLVNDGSSDNTLEIVQELAKQFPNLRIISYPVNCGRGKALRTGFEHARGKYVITIDFDLSYSPEHILRIYEELADPEQMNDVVLGSAYMAEGRVVGVNPWRVFISRLGNKILEYTFPQPFKTSTCILRGYRRQVLEALELESNGKEIHLEILSKVCALGFMVKEIPATLQNRKSGHSKFKLRKTSASHLVFSVFEKPLLVFGLVGVLLTLLGLAIGIYIVWLRYAGTLNPGRPLIPLMLILLIMGSQFFSFAFVAAQNNHLRNEIYRLQRQINLLTMKKRNESQHHS